GAGHTVTALYEIVPPGEEVNSGGIDPLKYQRPAGLADGAQGRPAMVPVPSTELMTVKVRYKKPDGDSSTLVTVPVAGRATVAPRHLGFAAAVAEFGMLLRQSPFKADATWADAAKLAAAHRSDYTDGSRAGFVAL